MEKKKQKPKPKDKAATALFGVVLAFVLKIAVSVVFSFGVGFCIKPLMLYSGGAARLKLLSCII